VLLSQSASPSVICLSSPRTINLGFLTEGKTLLLYSSHLPLGVPNGLVIYHASSTPSCAAMTLRRIFGSFVGRKKKVQDTTVQLVLSIDKLEGRLNKLPDREDFEHLALYSKKVIPRIDNELVDIMDKL
jgi:hypothetical protein